MKKADRRPTRPNVLLSEEEIARAVKADRQARFAAGYLPLTPGQALMHADNGQVASVRIDLITGSSTQHGSYEIPKGVPAHIWTRSLNRFRAALRTSEAWTERHRLADYAARDACWPQHLQLAPRVSRALLEAEV